MLLLANVGQLPFRFVKREGFECNMGTWHENHLGVRMHTPKNILNENYDISILFEVFIHIFYSVSIIKYMHIIYLLTSISVTRKNKTTEMLQIILIRHIFICSTGFLLLPHIYS